MVERGGRRRKIKMLTRKTERERDSSWLMMEKLWSFSAHKEPAGWKGKFVVFIGKEKLSTFFNISRSQASCRDIFCKMRTMFVRLSRLRLRDPSAVCPWEKNGESCDGFWLRKEHFGLSWKSYFSSVRTGRCEEWEKKSINHEPLDCSKSRRVVVSALL